MDGGIWWAEFVQLARRLQADGPDDVVIGAVDGLLPDNRLHDVRWGEDYNGQFVWVYEISGSVPASHLGGWDKAEGWRHRPASSCRACSTASQ